MTICIRLRFVYFLEVPRMREWSMRTRCTRVAYAAIMQKGDVFFYFAVGIHAFLLVDVGE